MNKSKYVIFILAVLFSSISGCVTNKPIPARLYSLETGHLIRAELSDFLQKHGTITVQLENGETLQGEYMFGDNIIIPPFANRPALGGILTEKEGSKINSDFQEKKEGYPWATVYGFGSGAEAKPKGTAIAVGSQGTTLRIVFYTINFQNQSGDGIGRDSRGSWYRVYLGNLGGNSLGR